MNINRFGIWAKSTSTQTWFSYVLLILLLGLAAGLRFLKLGEWSFWIDEIYTVNHATAHFSTLKLIIDHLPPNRNWVPISVILTAQALNFWGVSEWSARLTAAVIGILTISLLYFPLRKMFNTRVAIITALLLAISPWHIEWSQNARGYTSMVLFAWLAIFAFYYGLEKDRATYFVWFHIFLYLSASERLISLFIIPALVLYMLAVKFLSIEKPAGLHVRNMCILLAPFLLFGVYEVFGLIRNGESIIGAILVEIMSTFFGKPIENPLTQAIFQVYKLGIPLFAFSLLSGMYIWKQKVRAGWLIVLSAVIPFFLVILVTPFMFTEERYALVTLPAWLVLAAMGIDQLLIRIKKFEQILVVGLLFILLADALSADLLYYQINHGNRRDYRSAFAIVQANLQDGDMVVSTFSELGNYYLKMDNVVRWDDINKETIENRRQRVWFVIVPDMTWYSGTEDFYWWVSRHTQMVKTIYIRTINNTNIEVYLFNPLSNRVSDILK